MKHVTVRCKFLIWFLQGLHCNYGIGGCWLFALTILVGLSLYGTTRYIHTGWPVFDDHSITTSFYRSNRNIYKMISSHLAKISVFLSEGYMFCQRIFNAKRKEEIRIQVIVIPVYCLYRVNISTISYWWRNEMLVRFCDVFLTNACISIE